MLSRAERLEQLLKAGLQTDQITIVNRSEDHRHHAGDDGTGETHYDIVVVADIFSGQNRVQRQRTVNKIVQSEFDQGLHALSMTLKAPEE
ncbi:MAG: BolA family protein [Pseudomonadota bacterium]